MYFTLKHERNCSLPTLHPMQDTRSIINNYNLINMKVSSLQVTRRIPRHKEHQDLFHGHIGVTKIRVSDCYKTMVLAISCIHYTYHKHIHQFKTCIYTNMHT